METTSHMIMNDETPSTKHANKAKMALTGLAAVAIAVALFTLPVADYLKQALAWVDGLGPTGYVVFSLLYITACIFLLPGLILTLGGGLIFGVVGGTIVVSIASTLGATAAFLVGRFIARDWVAGKIAGNAKFAAIDEAVGQKGFLIVFLTRLSPVFPFNLLNYAYGLTKVRLSSYILASWIGMLPGTIMYVYLGSALGSIAQLGQSTGGASTGKTVLFWGGLAATIAIATLVTGIARKALKDAMA